MSFGVSIGDGVLLAQLAYKTFQGARQAGGEHDELAREVNSLYKVLSRLQMEIANTQSPINRANDERRQELEENAVGCQRLLKVMNSVLKRYNKLGPEERRGTRWWQQIRFGGRARDFAEIRIKLSTYTSAIMMSLNLCSLDSIGKIEATLRKLETQSGRNGQDIQGIRKSLHWVTAKMSATMDEGSVWTSYTNDDEMFWRTIRRELVDKGYNSSVLHDHKRTIKKYLEELGSRGVFDDQEDNAGVASFPEAQVELVEKYLVANENSHLERDSSPVPEPQSEVIPSSPSTISPQMESSRDSLASPTGENARETNLPVEEFPPIDVEAPCETEDPSAIFVAKKLVAQTCPSTYSQFHAYVEDCIDEDLMTFQRSEHPDAGPSTPPSENVAEESSTYVEAPGNDGLPSSVSINPTGMPDSVLFNVTEGDMEEATVLQAAGKDTEHTSQLAESRQFSDLKRPCVAQVEEVIDADFEIGSHPNVSLETEHLGPVFQSCEPPLCQDESEMPSSTSQSTASPIHRRNEPAPSTSKSTQYNSKPPKVQKHVHFSDSVPESTENQLVKLSDDLRFIFYHQYRDFGIYQELQESYQVSWDEKTASGEEPSPDNQETSTFITHSPYTPPATLFNLNYWSIPVNYFHTFWHPERVPLYLYGNVFDGISLANWINGWTALEFGEESFQMSTIKKFGDTVRKLGSAVSDIDNARPEQKAALPRDLYDLGTDTIWKDLESVLRDIMSEAQDRRSWSSSNSRLEGEFVKQLWANHILGATYNNDLSNFQQQAEDWIKRVKLHPDFVLLWDIYEI